ncbi:MAG: hypothetical protein K2O10_06215, partial [Muribaculaceae bacterium]|nr:hypothetical protein [Muribaculaceae bacterium]
MKKIYTLAMAAAVAMTAAAGTGAALRTGFDTNLKPIKEASEIFKAKACAKALPAVDAQTKSLKAPATAEEITGEYTIGIGDYYFEDSQVSLTAEGEITFENGYAVISCEPFPTDVFATYDATTGNLSFTTLNLGAATIQGTTYYIQFQPFEFTYTDPTSQQGKVSAVDYAATYSNGTFTFPTDHGFSWIAYSDAAYTQPVAYLDLFDIEGMTKAEPKPVTNWTSIGNATLVDGWVLPYFDINQNDPANQYEVELQQNDENKNVYRLVDPYHGNCPIADYNESTTVGYIQFDVTDPDHVMFEAVDAGFAYSQAGVKQFYCLNTLAFACNYLQASAEQVIAGDYGIPYTTFKNGVVSLGSVVADGATSYD